MSAYLVSTNTIHVIVRGGLQYGLIKRASADLVGQALIETNHWSLHARYRDEMPEPTTGYHLPVEVPKIQPAVIYSCTACFEYQACEFADWTHSAAYRYTEALRQRIARTRPEIQTRFEGGLGRDGEFVWGINAPDLDALDQYALPA